MHFYKLNIYFLGGIIPNSEVIHAARKKREMARQGDYVPFSSTSEIKSKMIK